LSAFAKTGVWPIDSEKVLQVIHKPVPPASTPASNTALQTPKSCCAIRRAHLAYQKYSESSLLDKIFNVNIQLAAQVEIHCHIISGLYTAILFEKKKRKKGKALNLVDEEDSRPQFYSPGHIVYAQEVQAVKEAEDEQVKQRIVEKKVQAAVNKAQKEAAIAEQALQTAARCQCLAEERAYKIEKKAAKKAAREALQTEKQA
jgi:hypothetical protein